LGEDLQTTAGAFDGDVEWQPPAIWAYLGFLLPRLSISMINMRFDEQLEPLHFDRNPSVSLRRTAYLLLA
jgi:hypothetical protein